MMEERYHATTQNRFYPDMSNVNKNITEEAKLISPPTYIKYSLMDSRWLGVSIHYRVADKSLARTGRKQATATEYFDIHVSYL